MRIAKAILFLFVYHNCFSQYEEQFQKFHAADSVENIKVWYFDYGTKIDFVRHQGYRDYTFGKRGKLLSSKCIDENNELVWQYQYEYDSLDRKILEIYHYGDQPAEIRNFSYNGEKKDVIADTRAVYSGETSELKKDKDGNIIEVKSFRSGEEIKINQYKYTKFDKRKNWVKMVWYKQNEPFRVYVRKIIYN